MGFIDDIVKIVDQVVEENLNNTLDNGELPHTEPKKAKVKKIKKTQVFVMGFSNWDREKIKSGWRSLTI
ncbi:hypothetical protein N752_18645 [Desulforamulus aquiferis]|nr:hypothetical protein [Desulforamulus aquiferis]RYD03767.1 hypothetical protein N752_18645 [Desulforamulus aquiferis]